MIFVKYGSIVLVTIVVVLGFSIPMVPNPQGFFEFPTIPILGEKARNIFFHVPIAWLTVLSYFVAMFYGIKFLRTKDQRYDLHSVSAAGLGTLFCVLATITGALWANFDWNSPWNWDPRETSIFILLLIYAAYFALRSALEQEEKRATLSAVYAVIAGLTTPFFIFVMPRMVAGLHPGSKGDVQGSGPVVGMTMSWNMRAIFFMSLIGFTLFYVWIFRLRVRTALIEYELQHQHE
jgi:heme exporter protein C